jgi:Integrase core domain
MQAGPRDFWLEDWEKRAIVAFHLNNPLEGYRRLTFMMLDADIGAVSPASVWRVLSRAGLLRKWNQKPSKKGTGFDQPPQPHQHWHIDVSYINIAGTFYYLCSVLDGFSRSIVHWDLRESMTEADIEIILQAAKVRIDPAVCGPLQHGAVAQRDWLCDTGRHAGWKAEGDPRHTRPQAGGGPSATATAPATGGLMVTMTLPGETEAGSAGMQPCRGITWRAHRDDDRSAEAPLPRSSKNQIGSVDPDALKIPARRAECSLTENARSPFQAEPGQMLIELLTAELTLIQDTS